MTTATIYGTSISPYVRKVLVVMAEKSLPYKHNVVIPFDKPEGFEKISPLGKIPVYRQGKLTIPDSSVICAYLEKLQPHPRLYPHNPENYAKALWFEEYADTAVTQTLSMKIFLPKVIYPAFLQRDADMLTVDKALQEDIQPIFNYLESQLTGQEFIIDNCLSIADVALSAHFGNFYYAGYSIDGDNWPKLKTYIENHFNRTSISALMQADQEKLTLGND